MNIPQLLSPVGSFDGLQAAINAGADAIYFGVEQLNMRAKSVNGFCIADLKNVSDKCHANKVACYLTLNTILYDHDIQLASLIVKEAKKAGIDAVIISDIAALEVCKKEKMPVHISTQANVSNFQSAVFYSQFADVIVLARELTLKQTEQIIKEIKRKKITGPSGNRLKIEIFCHGALCMAISGKCYLSLHSQNSSANRGACTQNCRHAYTVIDKETGNELLIDNEYIMSPKDLCTIHVLDEIVKTGVDVIKIEGRSKSAEYVYTVTKCYKEALTAIKNGEYTKEKIKKWQEELKTVYNRGFWEGYYLGRKMGEWTNDPGSIASEKKIYIGKGKKYYPAIKVAEFLIETGDLKEGDDLLIMGAEMGIEKIRIDKMRVNGEDKSSAGKGDLVTIPFARKIAASDKLYKLIKTEYA